MLLSRALIQFSCPVGGVYELGAFIGGAKSIFRWIYSAHGLAVQLDPDMNVIDFGLRSKYTSSNHKLPLGWYLSSISKDTIRNEMANGERQTHLNQSLIKFRKAFE